jgi:hypothetical protein
LDCKIVRKDATDSGRKFYGFKEVPLLNSFKYASLTFLNKLEEYTKSITD